MDIIRVRCKKCKRVYNPEIAETRKCIIIGRTGSIIREYYRTCPHCGRVKLVRRTATVGSLQLIEVSGTIAVGYIMSAARN